MASPRRRLVPLVEELTRVRPDLDDATGHVVAGDVVVDGRVVTNPRAFVRSGASIVVRAQPGLRGSAKLRAALDTFGIDVAGLCALDVGSAAGGFVQVLLDRGAARAYAVDTGHGQLRGSLRQDARVLNLESTNVSALDGGLVPDVIDVVTIDVSYLSLASAVAQLGRVRFAPRAVLVGLIKPMFELRLAAAPTEQEALRTAADAASAGIEAAGWTVLWWMESPVRGSRGAIEGLVHATRE